MTPTGGGNLEILREIKASLKEVGDRLNQHCLQQAASEERFKATLLSLSECLQSHRLEHEKWSIRLWGLLSGVIVSLVSSLALFVKSFIMGGAK